MTERGESICAGSRGGDALGSRKGVGGNAVGTLDWMSIGCSVAGSVRGSASRETRSGSRRVARAALTDGVGPVCDRFRDGASGCREHTKRTFGESGGTFSRERA